MYNDDDIIMTKNNARVIYIYIYRHKTIYKVNL